MNADNKTPLHKITLAAIGIVYGDIGTSPLYTLKECLSSHLYFGVKNDAVLGFLSLIFWLLILVVSIKYLSFVMRADDSGEGGILTLMSLSGKNSSGKMASILTIVGLIGSSFFYGEVVITPAISIMSAIEGLAVIAPQLSMWIVPLSIIILTLLFIIQKHGTGLVSKLFSPIMIAWFSILAILGVRSIVLNPYVLHALNPIWIVNFFVKYKTISFFTLGTVVLSITGVEALYADMGHFGKKPIRIAWFMLVFPSLVLNYLGQGALLLRQPEAIKNPFFFLAPKWALIPVLMIATLTTAIASQAVISGVFSLTKQAIHLGFLCPMRIVHTSEMESGQIYIPFVNWFLYVVVVIVIIVFAHSSNLAAAYGISITGTMVLTSILSTTIAYRNWHWNKFLVGTILVFCLCIDLPLFLSNLDKIIFGGWLPMLIGLVIFLIMSTWKNERLYLTQRMCSYGTSFDTIVTKLEKSSPMRIAGTAVYMSRISNTIPFALIQNIKHNKVLHERVILLTLHIEDTPCVHNSRRVWIEKLSSTFWRVVARYGWSEIPNVEEVFQICGLEGLNIQIMETSFFFSRKSLIIGKRPWYLRYRGNLYLILHRNALRASDYFKIPSNRIIEIGSQVEI